MNKGQCKIIDNDWKCEINKLEYKEFIYMGNTHHTKSASSSIKFDFKENKLIIPREYYRLIVVGYKLVTRSCGKHCSYKVKQNIKSCKEYGKTIYCSCSSINDFGLVTFHFENNSKLDLDLRNYVEYEGENLYYKCKTDFVLSDIDEFVIGLRGLNNTIFSFNMDEKKIEFFHKMQKVDYTYYIIGIIFLMILFLLSSILDDRRN